MTYTVLQNVNPIFALRRASKADVTVVVTALSSSLPLLNEDRHFNNLAEKSELWDRNEHSDCCGQIIVNASSKKIERTTLHKQLNEKLTVE